LTVELLGIPLIEAGTLGVDRVEIDVAVTPKDTSGVGLELREQTRNEYVFAAIRLDVIDFDVVEDVVV
jgi:hypothetical protein